MSFQKNEVDGLIKLSKTLSKEEVSTCLEDLTDANRNKLILGNLRLVAFVAKKRAMNDDDFLYYFSAGICGLIRAIDNFDGTRGSLSKYAYRLINNEIVKSFFKETSIVALNHGAYDHVKAIEKAEEDLRREFGRQPTDDEVFAKLGYSQKVKHTAKQAKVTKNSLHSVIGEDNETLLDCIEGSLLNPDESLDSKMMKQFFRNVIAKLPSDYRMIVKLRFYKGLTLDKVGEIMGYSRESIRLKEKEILRQLRETINEAGFRGYNFDTNNHGYLDGHVSEV